jgi:abortive infection bacteriophage resistance protein
MATYAKPHLTLAQQVDLLISRGMAIADRSAAEGYLSTVGYYRLSGYWYPYREIAGDPPARSDQFITGTSLDQVMALYDFDRRLKLLTLDALERVEITMRFRAGYVLGRRGPFAHLDSANFDGRFTKTRETRPSKFDEWNGKLAQAQIRSREDFVTHFNTKYDGRLPIWVATELLDFGGLSFLYEGMHRTDREEIAAELQVVDINLRATQVRWATGFAS